MIIISRLFALLYRTNRIQVLGLSLSTWLKLLPLILILIGAWFRWPAWSNYIWLLLWVVILLGYWLSGRAGYTRFIPHKNQTPPTDQTLLSTDQKISLKATGLFSISSREDYVLLHPAQYWRTNLSQHIFMVTFRQERFRYQIIKPEHIQTIQTGRLLFGAEPRPALALTFNTTWGPSVAEYSLYYVGGDANPDPSQQRTIYLTFNTQEDLHQVQQSLLQQ